MSDPCDRRHPFECGIKRVEMDRIDPQIDRRNTPLLTKHPVQLFKPHEGRSPEKRLCHFGDLHIDHGSPPVKHLNTQRISGTDIEGIGQGTREHDAL